MSAQLTPFPAQCQQHLAVAVPRLLVLWADGIVDKGEDLVNEGTDRTYTGDLGRWKNEIGSF